MINDVSISCYKLWIIIKNLFISKKRIIIKNLHHHETVKGSNLSVKARNSCSFFFLFKICSFFNPNLIFKSISNWPIKQCLSVSTRLKPVTNMFTNRLLGRKSVYKEKKYEKSSLTTPVMGQQRRLPVNTSNITSHGISEKKIIAIVVYHTRAFISNLQCATNTMWILYYHHPVFLSI